MQCNVMRRKLKKLSASGFADVYYRTILTKLMRKKSI